MTSSWGIEMKSGVLSHFGEKFVGIVTLVQNWYPPMAKHPVHQKRGGEAGTSESVRRRT